MPCVRDGPLAHLVGSGESGVRDQQQHERVPCEPPPRMGVDHADKRGMRRVGRAARRGTHAPGQLPPIFGITRASYGAGRRGFVSERLVSAQARAHSPQRGAPPLRSLQRAWADFGLLTAFVIHWLGSVRKC